jgi:hypothetical protein
MLLPKRKRFLGRKRKMSESNLEVKLEEMYPTDTEDEQTNSDNAAKQAAHLAKKGRIKKKKKRKKAKGARMR